VLVRGTSWRSTIISAYQRLTTRGRARRCASWSHVALVAGTDGRIVEAGTAGVVLRRLDKFREHDYHYVAVRATREQRSQAVRYAVSRVGSPYANLALVGLFVSVLTAGRLRWPGSRYDLCGSLVAGALTCAGERFELPPSEMMPADLAAHFGVAP
jgi:hypothetical protein